jgi:hypothetical protein
MSTAQVYLSMISLWIRRTASWADRLGRKPKLDGDKTESKIGISIWFKNYCISRSCTVGIPKGRLSPLPLGISVPRTGEDLCLPSKSSPIDLDSLIYSAHVNCIQQLLENILIFNKFIKTNSTWGYRLLT